MRNSKITYSLIIITLIVMFGIFKMLSGQQNNDQLKEIINDDAFLVDVRTPSEFSSGHVKGSVNISLDKISTELTKFKNKKHIVVFCRSGNRSGQAKSILQQNGFNNVTNGGTWQNVDKIKNE